MRNKLDTSGKMSKKYIPEIFWNKRAKDYGILGGGYINLNLEIYRQRIWMRKAFELLNVQAGLRILDAGCGTGKWSVELAKKGAIVTGIDLSKEMIKLAKELANKNQINDISFLNQKIEDLDYRNCFDAVISIVVLQHIIDEQHFNLAVEKIVRATRREGYILIINSTMKIKDEKRMISERGVEHMKLRTKQEWIDIFESKGAKFIKSREVCFIGKYLVIFCANRFKNKTIKKVAEKLSEFIDMNFTEWRLFKNYCAPTIFLFKK